MFASFCLSPTKHISEQCYSKLRTHSFFSFPLLSLLSFPVLSSLSGFDRMLSGYSSLPQHERPSLGWCYVLILALCRPVLFFSPQMQPIYTFFVGWGEQNVDCFSTAENMFLLLGKFLCGQASSGAGCMVHEQEVLWPDLYVNSLS